ncbi:uncharacterized protein At4g28440-like [Punica granatum]|uniref:Single-stranded DNA binding protein Ssb-like OB fold domain-containing protein n=2 Tax=Punica granatum TaxID=22663 RepID=A0A218WUL8_PUNGR|nr:uncharacterized protein At4g28440-like [Punica granatum]OWM76060.1 hypothetical protein CDL15_Pgr009705 [Punica granatum]PKI53966.1 hypothetical protein CRG98_025668 [Punica granatum]
MAESSKELKKPLVKKVCELRPLDSGLTLTVKVVDTKMVAPKGRQARTAESLVGDETGIIVFVARNDQVDMMKEGSTVILRNAKIEMYRGSMRLAVDRWGRIEATEPASFTVKEDCNLSLIEFETVNVVE